MTRLLLLTQDLYNKSTKARGQYNKSTKVGNARNGRYPLRYWKLQTEHFFPKKLLNIYIFIPNILESFYQTEKNILSVPNRIYQVIGKFLKNSNLIDVRI